MKIVFLDVKTIGEDIDLSGYDQLGEVVKYPSLLPRKSLAGRRCRCNNCK